MIQTIIENRCLNLCDQVLSKEKHLEIEWRRYSEIFIGSYTCGNYFLLVLRELPKICTSLHQACPLSRIRLVIPVLAEHQYEETVRQLEALKTKGALGPVYGVAVNDFAGLSLYQIFFAGREVTLGRIFFREYRDFRYDSYTNEVKRIKSVTLVTWIRETICYVNGAEIEGIGRKLDISAFPADCRVYLHKPLLLETYGHICEFASLYFPIQQKFRPDSPCAFACFEVYATYALDTGERYYKNGRAVYQDICGEQIQISGHSISVIESVVPEAVSKKEGISK